MDIFTKKTNFSSFPLNKTVKPKANDFLFIYDHKRRVALNEYKPVLFKEIEEHLPNATYYAFGEIDGIVCFICYPNQPFNQYKYYDVRFTFGELDEAIFQAASYACHLAYWHKINSFCSACGHKMIDKKDEQAKLCQSCGHVVYTQISPSIIVLIKKGDDILLGRSPFFLKGRYSLLAGYVEPGETLEQAVHREVFEEAGIKIKNILYEASQPWAFSSSLMIGFSAEYDSGEIKIDPKEIEDAAWFSKDNLPILPNEISIAHYLISQHYNL